LCSLIGLEQLACRFEIWVCKKRDIKNRGFCFYMNAPFNKGIKIADFGIGE
jgi:hypothetical protein